jgi:hypothetical protein
MRKEMICMINLNVFKIAVMVCLTCCSSTLFGQISVREQEVVNLLKQGPIVGVKKLPPAFIEQFNASDVPIICDIVLDSKHDKSVRIKATYVFSYLDPDQTQIDRINQFGIINLPLYNYTEKTGDGVAVDTIMSIGILYDKTANDLALKPYRDFYFNESCSDGCKASIMSLLIETDSNKNISFYNKILNDPHSTMINREDAALGLAQAGSLESLAYLKDMVKAIYETNDSFRIQFILPALERLTMLSSKHYEAARVLQEIITDICNYSSINYDIKLMEPSKTSASMFVGKVFKASQGNDQEGNRRYFEDLLDCQCAYPFIPKLTIQTLGAIGNEGTISILKRFEDIYPYLVQDAIDKIQARIQ